MTFHLALYFTLLSLLCHPQGSHISLPNRRFWRLTWTNNRQYSSSWTKSCEDYNCFDRIVCIAYSKVSVAQSAQSFQVAICTATSCLWWTFELFVTRHLNSTTLTRVLNCYSQITKSWTEDTAQGPDSRMSISVMIFQVALVWRVSSQPGFFIGILLPLTLPSLILPLLAILHSLTQVSVDVKFEPEPPAAKIFLRNSE